MKTYIKSSARNYKMPCALIFIYLFILMILMREGDTPECASPKGLGWPLHREKKKNLNKMKAGNPSQTQKIGQYQGVLMRLEQWSCTGR